MITNFLKINVEDIGKLIGTIREIQIDGMAVVDWIDDSVSKKKLVELVNFFEFEFGDSDFSEDEEESFSSCTKEVDTSQDSVRDESSDNCALVEKKNSFTEQYKFNKYKFECVTDDLRVNFNSTIDETRFKDKWLKKIETIHKLIDDFKAIQLDQLNKQGIYSEANHAEDKKIIDYKFSIIRCYFEKIKNNITLFNLVPDRKNDFDSFYLRLVFSLNNWLDIVQSTFEFLFILFDENSEFNRLKVLRTIPKLPSYKEPNKESFHKFVDQVSIRLER